jgi:metal-responsive CopG/Arc/MetJ family transcriptional regulator
MLTRMKSRSGLVQRVTISLPADLFAKGEAERRRRSVTRSEYVAQLYVQHLEEEEKQARVARYAAAYAAHPSSPAEDAVLGASAEALETLETPPQ